MRRSLALLASTPLFVFGLAGCNDSPATPPLDGAVTAAQIEAFHAAHANHANPAAVGAQRGRGHGDLLKSVRQATARFNSTDQAARAGYEPFGPCIAGPAGGMGYHWVDFSRVTEEWDPLAPEAILYERGPGGNLRLVGVEYIVIDGGQDRPEFDGYPFDVGGVGPLEAQGIPHWSLHVWVHKHNPAGTFEPFNPDVGCD